MEIIIGKKVKTPTNGYVVEIETMYGDADGEGKVIIGTFKVDEKELLEDLLLTCERMEEAYPHGRGGGDDYYHVEGFNKWFNIDDTTDEEYENLPERIKELSRYWEHEPDGYGGHASYRGYEVFYYDENGVKYETKLAL